jgi:membrane protein
MKKKDLWFRHWQYPHILWLSIKRFRHEKFSSQASALAFLTMLSLVPLSSVLIYVISFFPIFSAFVQLAQEYIYSNFIPNTHSSELLLQYFSQFTLQASQLPKFSIAFSIVTGIILVRTIQHVLDQIWREKQETKSMLTMFFAWVILLLMPIFIGISTFLSTYLSSWFNQMQYFILYDLHLLINTLLLGTLYVIIPNKIVKWGNAMVGGLTAVILFEVVRRFFVFYIAHFTTYEFIYGALAIVPILMVWLYVCMGYHFVWRRGC